jgi:hypothetical protein
VPTGKESIGARILTSLHCKIDVSGSRQNGPVGGLALARINSVRFVLGAHRAGAPGWPAQSRACRLPRPIRATDRGLDRDPHDQHREQRHRR